MFEYGTAGQKGGTKSADIPVNKFKKADLKGTNTKNYSQLLYYQLGIAIIIRKKLFS